MPYKVYINYTKFMRVNSKNSDKKGEIAALLTLSFIGLMSLGIVIGSRFLSSPQRLQTQSQAQGNLFHLTEEVYGANTQNGINFNAHAIFNFDGCDGDITLYKGDALIAGPNRWNKNVNPSFDYNEQWTQSPYFVPNDGQTHSISFKGAVNNCPKSPVTLWDTVTCDISYDSSNMPVISPSDKCSIKNLSEIQPVPYSPPPTEVPTPTTSAPNQTPSPTQNPNNPTATQSPLTPTPTPSPTGTSPTNNDCTISLNPQNPDDTSKLKVNVTSQKQAKAAYVDLRLDSTSIQSASFNSASVGNWNYDRGDIGPLSPGQHSLNFYINCSTPNSCQQCGSLNFTVASSGKPTPTGQAGAQCDTSTSLSSNCAACINTDNNGIPVNTATNPSCTLPQIVFSWCKSLINIPKCAASIVNKCKNLCSINDAGLFSNNYQNVDYSQVIKDYMNGSLNPIQVSSYVSNATRAPGLQIIFCNPARGECNVTF